MKENKLYLVYMVECVRRIEEYTQSGYDAFMQSTLIQDAVMRNFEVIGEATKQLSQELKSKYPEIPWRQVAGFRDILIHDYMSVDLDEVWGIVHRYVPDLKNTLDKILKDLEGN